MLIFCDECLKKKNIDYIVDNSKYYKIYCYHEFIKNKKNVIKK